ncbi:MAG: hypothetical protein ACYCW6_03560 [Candidatus Xenobia bacterium]
MSEGYVQEITDAGEVIYQALQDISPEEKEILRYISDLIAAYCKEQEKLGQYVDRSALFVAGILSHTGIQSPALRQAAARYLEIDHRITIAVA